MKTTLFSVAMLFIAVISNAQEWSNISIPANAGNGKEWQLQTNLSDDFSYTNSFNSGGFADRSNFGPNNQWYNFYHNSWDGPGYSYWNNSQVSVDGDNLAITVAYTSKNSKGGSYGVASGCVTSNSKVSYPAYVEASVSVANISLASCFWLLSPDDTEEIDIIENYGGVSWFKNFTHISHHSFVRNPFTDYQPRDKNSWYPISKITDAGGWGPYCWNGGNRRYMRMGVYWISPKHFEYYIDGDLVRVMYYNAMATKINGTWEYTYYNSVTKDGNGYSMPTNGNDGYSDVTTFTTSSSYSLSTLQNASNASKGYNVIDTGWFQGGDDNDLDSNGITNEARGFTKDLDIIINMESQSWLTGSTPSAADLADASKNKMLVDWVRVYKPVDSSNTGVGSTITIEAESFSDTDGTFNDGYVSYGVNNAGTKINYVNKGDWVEYLVSIPEDGAYEITYYTSSPITGSTIDFSVSGTYFNTTTVPNNGSWDNYQALKASKTANFSAGNHLIKLTAGSTNWTWNMDKFTLERVSEMKSASVATNLDSESYVRNCIIHPNPASDVVNIKITDVQQSYILVDILSICGKRILMEQVPTNSDYVMDISSLNAGVYLVKVGNNKPLKLVVK